MSFSMSGASLSVFELGLNTLSALLDKAEGFAAAKKVDPTVLLHTRLAPDMFDFTRQVQVVSDQARRGAARLAGAEPPSVEDTDDDRSAQNPARQDDCLSEDARPQAN